MLFNDARKLTGVTPTSQKCHHQFYNNLPNSSH
jgi:hypothetical protein